MGLVTLSLVMVDSSAYFRLNELLRQVSLMAHVENLIIGFHFPVSESARYVEQELSQVPNKTNVTLPKYFSDSRVMTRT